MKLRCSNALSGTVITEGINLEIYRLMAFGELNFPAGIVRRAV